MSWTDIEVAMQRAIVRASALPASRVVWSYQNVNEPELDHAVITFGGETQIGQDWIRNQQDLTRPNGQEIRQDVFGTREVPFTVEVFTSATTGEASARRLCELIRTKLRLDSVRAGIRKVGVSPFDPGPVQWVPDIPKARFRGRAMVTIRCYVPVVDCFEYVGYIARIRGTTIIRGHTGPSGATGFNFDSNNG